MFTNREIRRASAYVLDDSGTFARRAIRRERIGFCLCGIAGVLMLGATAEIARENHHAFHDAPIAQSRPMIHGVNRATLMAPAIEMLVAPAHGAD